MNESQKLFRLPGTIEEEEKEERGMENRRPKEELEARAESPLLRPKSGSTLSALPRNITLLRVSTQSSSIAGGVGRQDSTRSRYRAGPTRKLRRRAVLKNGDCNVLKSRISRRSLRFLQDIFTTLVDTQWRWTLLCFILSFFLSWLGFAVIWWLIAFTHGDFEESHLPPFQVENNWTPCVYNIFSFTSCFLFSIETQHTIGYGSRSTTEECPEAIFVMCIQSISGVMIQAFMVGIVFAKMTRPKQRSQTLLFSRNAVICQRDGELCLMFRVGDMRKSHIIGASVRAQVIRTRTTKEGEVLMQNQQELVVGTDGQNGDLFFIWPTTIVHQINETSPFYSMSAEDMLTERFEIVLILEGTIESTGQSTQARSSYLPQEILWGHRFDPMVSYSKERQGYEVDYSLFNSTTQVDTPLCSGRELTEFYKVQEDLHPGTDEDLRKVSSEPKSVPVMLDAFPRTPDSMGFHLVHQDNASSQDILIDGNQLMEQQCRCRPTINHRCLKLSLVSLDTSKSHDNAEDDQWWQNAKMHANSNYFPKGSNYTSYESQIAHIDQLKTFDFDPDTIQVMEDAELDQLPNAVHREILKNTQEIIPEKEEESFKKNEVRGKILRNNRDIIHEENEKNVRIPKRNFINGGKNERDFKLKCKQLARKNYEMYLEKKLEMRDQICQTTPTIRDQNNPQRYFYLKEHQRTLNKLDRSLSDDTFLINAKRSFKEFERTAINESIISINQNQKTPKQKSSKKFNRNFTDDSFGVDDIKFLNLEIGKDAINRITNRKNQEMCLEDELRMSDTFPNKKQKLSMKFDKNLIDDSYMHNDEKTLKDSRVNMINDAKNIRMLEEGRKSLKGSRRYYMMAFNHSNSNLFSRQLSNSPDWESETTQHDNVRIESEKFPKRSPARLAKIAIQQKHRHDFWSPVFPISPESGFCDGTLSNSSPECERREPRLIPRNRLRRANAIKKNSSLSESNLQNKICDVSSREYPLDETTNYNDVENVNEVESSSLSNLPYERFVDDGDNPQ